MQWLRIQWCWCWKSFIYYTAAGVSVLFCLPRLGPSGCEENINDKLKYCRPESSFSWTKESLKHSRYIGFWEAQGYLVFYIDWSLLCSVKGRTRMLGVMRSYFHLVDSGSTRNVLDLYPRAWESLTMGKHSCPAGPGVTVSSHRESLMMTGAGLG